MSAPITQVLTNSLWDTQTRSRLSVLIPFYSDNPIRLIEQLAATNPGGVDVTLFDDGVVDLALNAELVEALNAFEIPLKLISSRVNQGRSGARNRLAKAARSPWLLFLDADMDIEPTFLTRWISHTQTTSAGALFGGFTPTKPTPSTKLHAALADASDVHTAEQRQRLGPISVCSSNLAVRADVFAETPFDEGYAGWGWEDVDWALSASAKTALSHVDNPANHGGLETVDRLIQKFGQSGPNFARLMARHPDYAERPGAKLALKIKHWRLAFPARFAGSLVARLPVLPLRLRVLGLKLYRAGVAARALS